MQRDVGKESMPMSEGRRQPQTLYESRRLFGRRAVLTRWLAGGGIGALFHRQSPSAQTRMSQNLIDLLKTLPVAHRRRVVTGHNASGKSYIVSDEIIPDNSGGPHGSSMERMADGGTIPGHMDLWATGGEQPLG